MNLAIILLNYCNAKLTIDCLHSLKACDGYNYKVDMVVVDNDSDDNSMELFEKEKEATEFILLKSDRNNGFAAGNNVGIRYCLDVGYDYIMLLNNDTEVQTDFLQILGNELCESTVIVPKIMSFYQKKKIWYAGGTINRWTGKAWHFGENDIDSSSYNKRREVEFASGCCIVLHSDTIREIGLLQEDFFLYWEDAEYSARIISSGFPIVYIPSLVVFHKINSSIGKSSKTLLYYGTRNRIHFVGMYKDYFHLTAKYITIFVEVLKVLFYLFKDKSKSQIIAKGIKDGINNIRGKSFCPHFDKM